jgi:hypothetical protein
MGDCSLILKITQAALIFGRLCSTVKDMHYVIFSSYRLGVFSQTYLVTLIWKNSSFVDRETEIRKKTRALSAGD